MWKKVIQLWPEDEKVTLTAYPAEKDGAPAVLILPGGGYVAISQGEGEPVAEYFASRGFGAFVLDYSTIYTDFSFQKDAPSNPRAAWPGPLLDLAQAMCILHSEAQSFGIDREKIILCGFSAGGHLAASFGNAWSSPELASRLGVKPETLRPAAQILSYALTDYTRPNATDEGNPLSRLVMTAVFGTTRPRPEQTRARSPYTGVNADTPPTFLWHTADDSMVDVTDSQKMAQALLDAGIPCELHIFDHGPHAAALSKGLPAEIWPELAIAFLKRHLS